MCLSQMLLPIQMVTTDLLSAYKEYFPANSMGFSSTGRIELTCMSPSYCSPIGQHRERTGKDQTGPKMGGPWVFKKLVLVNLHKLEAGKRFGGRRAFFAPWSRSSQNY